MGAAIGLCMLLWCIGLCMCVLICIGLCIFIAGTLVFGAGPGAPVTRMRCDSCQHDYLRITADTSPSDNLHALPTY